MEIIALAAIVVSVTTLIMGYFGLRQTVSKSAFSKLADNDLHGVITRLSVLEIRINKLNGLDERITRLEKRIEDRVAGIEEKINQINTSIAKLSEWCKGHETLDNSRHATGERNISDLWKKVDPK